MGTREKAKKRSRSTLVPPIIPLSRFSLVSRARKFVPITHQDPFRKFPTTEESIFFGGGGGVVPSKYFHANSQVHFSTTISYKISGVVGESTAQKLPSKLNAFQATLPLTGLMFGLVWVL